MRPRTPSFIWIPFVLSVGGMGWILLVASTALLAVTILAPELQKARLAEMQRNDLQATLELLDKKVAMQKEFVAAATTDPLLMQRLASRQLHLDRKDQEVLTLDPMAPYRDRSITSLIAESLVPVAPKPVPPLPWFLQPTLHPTFRPLLLILACGGLLLSFVLGIRFAPR